ncbi:MAG: NAD(P)H-hydrate dehydratase [Dehalococcoidales bacterium]|nr:MAG: NAD(P)H-hydrate dehydratase [Dehalococcoidales bacterium]
MKIVTADQMMRIDRECAENGLPTSVLMENAGKAVAVEVTRILGDYYSKKIVILAGPGNNGGDGLVAARYLYDSGLEVSIYLFGKERINDPNLNMIHDRNISCTGVTTEHELEGFDADLRDADAILDALFGTGNNRPVEGIFRQALDKVGKAVEKSLYLHVFAVDIPSGMNADTGAVDAVCLYADDTITLGYPKIGMYNQPGSDRVGRITIVDIGIPSHMGETISLELNTAERVKSLLPRRPTSANKGTFGKVLVIAGSMNYIGAAYLACSGAMRIGAGLVTLATPVSLQTVLASKLTEATYLPLPEINSQINLKISAKLLEDEIPKYDSLLVGCGLGQSEQVVDLVKRLLFDNEIELPPVVLDADALNILANEPEWWRQFKGNAILTPHPGEMSRLTEGQVNEIQQDRLNAAEEAAQKWNQTVVLKGAYSVIASPGKPSVINPAANPGLASAGTGDVLAGVIAGLLGQGLTFGDAASCGVYVHGEAGENVREKLGDTGMIASDLLPELPVVIKKIKEGISG